MVMVEIFTICHLTMVFLKFKPWSWSKFFDHMTMTPGRRSNGQKIMVALPLTPPPPNHFWSKTSSTLFCFWLLNTNPALSTDTSPSVLCSLTVSLFLRSTFPVSSVFLDPLKLNYSFTSPCKVTLLLDPGPLELPFFLDPVELLFYSTLWSYSFYSTLWSYSFTRPCGVTLFTRPCGVTLLLDPVELLFYSTLWSYSFSSTLWSYSFSSTLWSYSFSSTL